MNTDIPSRLHAERRRLRLTQAQVAHSANVSRPTVAAYELGKTTADAGYLAAIAELGVDVHYVLTGRSFADAAVDVFDWEIAEAILTGIQDFAAASGLRISAAKQVRLLRVLYPQAARDKKVDPKAVAAALKLAA